MRGTSHSNLWTKVPRFRIFKQFVGLMPVSFIHGNTQNFGFSCNQMNLVIYPVYFVLVIQCIYVVVFASRCLCSSTLWSHCCLSTLYLDIHFAPQLDLDLCVVAMADHLNFIHSNLFSSAYICITASCSSLFI